ncbi:MAG: recombinase family protein [Lachnospiraceae bacterium]|nr:recombinase family protein [Lachnospiraceae bacterium]
MARTSRKNKKAQAECIQKKWRVAVYGRISKYNAGRSDAESLEVQSEYVVQYLNNKPEFQLEEIYLDNGYTGRNFDRPEFKRLMQDIQNKRIDCIVVKDLSRFGRNFVEAGYYLERMFPFIGVRFIAINDQYDSEHSTAKNGMTVPIKGVLNELYSKDLSKKVRNSFEQKRKNGDNLSVVAYGYRKDEDNQGKLLIDEEVSGFVKIIFDKKCGGASYEEIAKMLITMEAPIPQVRREQLGLVKVRKGNRRETWKGSDVCRILKNPIYTGCIAYNRFDYVDGYRKTPKDNPREKWMMVENSNPSIVSMDAFDKIYEIMQKEADRRERKKAMVEKRPENIFSGLAFCHQCGSPLYAKSVYGVKGVRFQNILCRKCEKEQRVEIADILLQILVMDQIRLQIEAGQLAMKLKEQFYSSSNYQKQEKVYREELQRCMSSSEQMKSKKRRLYEDYVEGILDEKEYSGFRDKLAEQEKEISKKLQEARKMLEEYTTLGEETKLLPYKDVEAKLMNFSEELLRSLVKRIEIDKDNNLFLTFIFKDQVICIKELEAVI